MRVSELALNPPRHLSRKRSFDYVESRQIGLLGCSTFSCGVVAEAASKYSGSQYRL